MAEAKTTRQLQASVIGEDGSGKSSLVIRFVQIVLFALVEPDLVTGVFPEKHDPTVVDFYRKQQHSHLGYPVVWEIIDTVEEFFGGSTGRMMRGVQAFLLVFDITSRSTFEGLPKLRENIHVTKDADYIPSVLLGLKSDLSENRQVSMEEGEELARKWSYPYLEVSSKAGENVTEAFEHLITEFDKVNPTVPRRRPHKAKKRCSIL